MPRKAFFLLIIAVSCLSGQVLADTLLSVKLHDSGLPRVQKPARDEVTTVWIGDGKARTNNQYKSMIYDQAARKIYILDHEFQRYSELVLPVDFLAVIPLEAVPGVEAQLKESQLAFNVMGTGKHKKIGEWMADEHLIDITSPTGRRTKVEIWTSDVGVDLSPYKKLVHEVAALQPLNQDWMRVANRFDGFPVLRQVTRFFETDQSVVREELLSVETKAAPEGTYRPPADYTQVPYNPVVRESD